MSLIITGDAATTRTAIGLGTAATKNVGTSADNVLQLDGSGRIPAVDGSNITGITAGVLNTPSFVANLSTQGCWENWDYPAYDSAGFNDGSDYNTSTYVFTPSVAGIYFVTAQLRKQNSAKIQDWQLEIRKNGSQYAHVVVEKHALPTYDETQLVSAIVSMNGSTDYLQIRAYSVSLAPTACTDGATDVFTVFRIA